LFTSLYAFSYRPRAAAVAPATSAGVTPVVGDAVVGDAVLAEVVAAWDEVADEVADGAVDVPGDEPLPAHAVSKVAAAIAVRTLPALTSQASASDAPGTRAVGPRLLVGLVSA
jgi:hypothetical protein